MDTPCTTAANFKMSAFSVYQIYYDTATRQSVEPGFIPLDNMANERPDWFELWVIRNFLNQNHLDPQGWYGFLSPSFRHKTGVSSEQVQALLRFADSGSDVALIPFAWEQSAFFRNPFEQGEVFHPGITRLVQGFLDHLQIDIQVDRLLTHTGNFTFSNYVIARPAYWRKWLFLANAFFEFVEHHPSPLAQALRGTTSYGSQAHQAPIKTFIQERFTALILADSDFKIATFDISATAPIFERLFEPTPHTRGLLQSCDFLKKRYLAHGAAEDLTLYLNLRERIPRRFQLPGQPTT